jgi:polyisoprenoid-binding protein YceI
MKKILLSASLLALACSSVSAADYVIDTKGAHASINFKIQHLGYSWLTGRFNDFEGKFSYDKAQPQASKITVNINTESVDTNHADRNKHLRSKDFLDVEQFPKASFVSSEVTTLADGSLSINGDFTLHGVTKPIVIQASKVGEGSDPWGGYRAGFAGTTTITMADYGITYNLGPASTHVDLELHIEGIKQ